MSYEFKKPNPKYRSRNDPTPYEQNIRAKGRSYWQSSERAPRDSREIRQTTRQSTRSSLKWEDPTPLREISSKSPVNDIEADRDWYQMESQYQSSSLESYLSSHEKYYQQKPVKTTRKDLYRKEKQQDQDKWIRTLLSRSGYHSDEDEEQQEDTIHLVLNDSKPKFAEGIKLADEIRVVKDPTSDMAVLARKGSQLVVESRERKERERQSRDALKLEGSMIGNVLGVSENVDESKKEGSTSAVTQATTENIPHTRQSLPIFSVRDQLLQLIRDNQVVVLVGETGSGKTTQLTQYLYEDGYQVVGCTQPRRVAAMSVAKRVAAEVGCEVGETVGYSIRFEDITSSETKIKYMTEGVLLRELLRDPDLFQYQAIILDEAHERSIHTDVLMGLLKRVLRSRRDLKLIVTSATMDSSKFSRFFGNAVVYEIPGRTFPVEVLYSRSTVDDYVLAAVKQVLAIHLNTSDGDILVFMTGEEDITVTCDEIDRRLKEMTMEEDSKVQPLLVLPIYSQLPQELQQKIFSRQQVRKVVVATNIAETSLTVDGVKFVVDSGYCKLKVYNSRMGMDILQINPISQANANQRSGRAGRTSAGVCYRLYTEHDYSLLLQSTVPEIQRTNLSNVVLLLKSLQVKDLLSFEFMDPPPRESVLGSMYQLWMLNALDDSSELTDLGRKMVEFPLDPPLSKMIITSIELGCLQEVLSIVAMLSVPNVFYRPKGREEESDQMRERFFVNESDHLTLLNVYNSWRDRNYSRKFCEDSFLHEKSLWRAKEVREQLVDILKKMKIPSSTAGYNLDIVRKAIASSYFHHAARQRGIGEYTSLRTGMPVNLHPTSALFGLGYMPEYIVYHELFMTTKEYIMVCTQVDPHWLADYGSKMYLLREAKFGKRRVVNKDETEEEKKEEAPVRPSTQKVVEMGSSFKRFSTPLIRSKTPKF